MPDAQPVASAHEQDAIAGAWDALTAGEPEPVPRPTPVLVTGPGGQLPSHFCVEEIAVASVAVALLAASALSARRGGGAPTVELDRGHVADAVRSERHFGVGGQRAGMGFAPLSRFWRAADGWVRTHANYPWHKRRSSGPWRPPTTPTRWRRSWSRSRPPRSSGGCSRPAGSRRPSAASRPGGPIPRAGALAEEPLIAHRMIGDAPPRRRGPGDLPLSGVRVVDLTRVIAGPVCTRFLAALGAEVVRLDPPGRPDMAAGAGADTLLGKRSAMVDLGEPAGLATLHGLLAEADVIVCGYRLGALDRFGLDERSLVERHPGVVSVRIDAWGHRGPWAGRRGFDSVVQAPTGIALGESVGPGGAGRPALPAPRPRHRVSGRGRRDRRAAPPGGPRREPGPSPLARPDGAVADVGRSGGHDGTGRGSARSSIRLARGTGQPAGPGPRGGAPGHAGGAAAALAVRADRLRPRRRALGGLTASVVHHSLLSGGGRGVTLPPWMRPEPRGGLAVETLVADGPTLDEVAVVARGGLCRRPLLLFPQSEREAPAPGPGDLLAGGRRCPGRTAPHARRPAR